MSLVRNKARKWLHLILSVGILILWVSMSYLDANIFLQEVTIASGIVALLLLIKAVSPDKKIRI